MNYYIGCDIGSDSAMAIIDDNLKLELIQYPEIKKSHLDLPGISKEFKDIFSRPASHFYVGIEDVHSVGMSGKRSDFNFGENKGIIEGIVFTYGVFQSNISIFFIQPKEWQEIMWCTNDYILKQGTKKPDPKPTSLKCAKRIFPSEDFMKKNARSSTFSGFYDSALIACATRLKSLGKYKNDDNYNIPLF